MADLDINNFPPSSGIDESDPAAEFLRREQDALAALEDNDIDFGSHAKSNNVDSNLTELNENYANGDANGEENALHMNGPTNDKSSPKGQQLQDKIPPPEPEKIRKWREEQQRLLEQKDAEEAVKKEELRHTAKRELEEWYARYKEQLEKSKINNRNAEKEWVAERDAEVPGQEWEKITRMCDFNPKSTRNTKDTSRMRSILLQLKQNPPPSTTSKQKS